jgi:hypothetical protein
MPPRQNLARLVEEDVPRYDFAGRRLRLVKTPLARGEEPSPLVEAIVKYLETLR